MPAPTGSSRSTATSRPPFKLLPLGLLAYGLMVFLGSRDPVLAAASQRAPRPRLSSPTFRTQIEAIERAQHEIQRSVSQAGGPVGRLLMGIDDLENVLAETVRLRTADAVSADSATNQVAQRLTDLKSDMDTFQRVLDTALASATSWAPSGIGRGRG